MRPRRIITETTLFQRYGHRRYINVETTLFQCVQINVEMMFQRGVATRLNELRRRAKRMGCI